MQTLKKVNKVFSFPIRVFFLFPLRQSFHLMVLSSTLCQACPLEGKVRCSGCHKIGVLTRYCSRKCQEILWVTHKDHCGKNNGLFVHPDATPVEVMACIRGVLGREATADPDGKYFYYGVLIY